jgi:hypothetical protein
MKLQVWKSLSAGDMNGLKLEAAKYEDDKKSHRCRIEIFSNL